MPSRAPAGRLKYAARAWYKRVDRSAENLSQPLPASCAQQSSVICVLSSTRGKVPRYQLSFLGHFSWLPYLAYRVSLQRLPSSPRTAALKLIWLIQRPERSLGGLKVLYPAMLSIHPLHSARVQFALGRAAVGVLPRFEIERFVMAFGYNIICCQHMSWQPGATSLALPTVSCVRAQAM